jgi:hypothetical protein
VFIWTSFGMWSCPLNLSAYFRFTVYSVRWRTRKHFAGAVVTWSRYCPGTCMEEPRKTINLRIVGVPAEIQTENLAITSLQHYLCGNPFGNATKHSLSHWIDRLRYWRNYRLMQVFVHSIIFQLSPLYTNGGANYFTLDLCEKGTLKCTKWLHYIL